MNPILVKCYNAGGAIPINTIVKFSGAGTVVAAAASTDALIGVLRGITAAVSGDRVDVIQDGIANVNCGGTVTRGDKITSDASGNGVTWSTGRVLGIALESGVAGDIIRVELKQN